MKRVDIDKTIYTRSVKKAAQKFAAAITNTKHYRVCHIYDKCAQDLIIGISTEVEQ